MSTFPVSVCDQQVEVTTTGFRGGHFSDFYAAQGRSSGPGWYVYGTNPAYGGSYTMLCARPDVAPRRARYWNGLVRPGWHTKREARRVADALNARDADSRGVLELLGELHGTEFRGESV